jgi:hypothetical protein
MGVLASRINVSIKLGVNEAESPTDCVRLDCWRPLQELSKTQSVPDFLSCHKKITTRLTSGEGRRKTQNRGRTLERREKRGMCSLIIFRHAVQALCV